MAERNLALQILINAKDQASGVLDGIKGKFSAFTGAVGALFATFGAVGFGGFLKSTIDAADALDELSQKTGVSVRALAGLQRLPDLAEIPIENVGKAINKLSIYMSNNAEEAVKMGISAQDPVDALYQFADVFANTESAQERAALGAKVLGKSYADLAPILLQGGDALRQQVDAFAEQSGVTEDAAARAGELNDKMTNLSTAVKDFAGRAVLPAIAPLSELVKYFSELFFATDKASQSATGATQVYTFVAKTLAGIGFVIDTVGRGIGALAAKFTALATLDFDAIGNIDKAFWEDNAAAMEKFADAIGKIESPDIKSTANPVKQITTDVDVALDKFNQWGAESKTVTDGIADNLKRLSDVELQDLKNTLTDAFETGTNRSKELQDAIDAIQTEEVTRAWKTLGQESSASLKQASDAARSAYVTIRDSGQASAKDLENAWSAYINKVLQAKTAISEVDAAEKQRQQNLADLDAIGATAAQQSELRKRELTQQTVDFEKAMNEGRLADAVQIAREREQLALDNAKAEKQAFVDGEQSSGDAYLARLRYLKSVEDTKKAVDSLKQSEQAQIQSNDQPTQQDDLAAKQQELTKLQATLDLLKQPVNLQINANFAEAINAADQLQQRINALNASIQNANAAATAAVNGTGDSTAQTLSTEVLKRGSRT